MRKRMLKSIFSMFNRLEMVKLIRRIVDHFKYCFIDEGAINLGMKLYKKLYEKVFSWSVKKVISECEKRGLDWRPEVLSMVKDEEIQFELAEEWGFEEEWAIIKEKREGQIFSFSFAM